MRRDKLAPLDMNQNLFRQFVYMSTNAFWNWLSISGSGTHETGPFTLRDLHSRDWGANLDFRVGHPWGNTALVTGYSLRDLEFRPLVREWFSTSSYIGLERKFGDNIRIRAVGEYVRGWRVQDLTYVLGQEMRPAAQFSIKPAKNWSIDGSFAYSRGMGFHTYDNFDTGLLLSYVKPLRRSMDDGSGAVPVDYPLRFSVGFQQESFPNFSGNHSTMFVPVVRLSVF
jgi:hypothetical protein